MRAGSTAAQPASIKSAAAVQVAIRVLRGMLIKAGSFGLTRQGVSLGSTDVRAVEAEPKETTSITWGWQGSTQASPRIESAITMSDIAGAGVSWAVSRRPRASTVQGLNVRLTRARTAVKTLATAERTRRR
jgi:hypothetical protein